MKSLLFRPPEGIKIPLGNDPFEHFFASSSLDVSEDEEETQSEPEPDHDPNESATQATLRCRVESEEFVDITTTDDDEHCSATKDG